MGTDRTHFPPPDQPEEPTKEEPSLYWKIIGVLILTAIFWFFILPLFIGLSRRAWDFAG